MDGIFVVKTISSNRQKSGNLFPRERVTDYVVEMMYRDLLKYGVPLEQENAKIPL